MSIDFRRGLLGELVRLGVALHLWRTFPGSSAGVYGFRMEWPIVVFFLCKGTLLFVCLLHVYFFL